MNRSCRPRFPTKQVNRGNTGYRGRSPLMRNQKRFFALFGLVAAVTAGALFWINVIEPSRRHFAFCQDVTSQLETLAYKRPSGLSRQQWQQIFSWTLNANANTFPWAKEMAPADMDEFQINLRKELSQPVTLNTVDWIWDEMARLTPTGRRYADRYRPTTQQKLQEFTEGGGLSSYIEVE